MPRGSTAVKVTKLQGSMKKKKVLLRTAKKQARKKNQQCRAVVNVDNKTKKVSRTVNAT